MYANLTKFPGCLPRPTLLAISSGGAWQTKTLLPHPGRTLNFFQSHRMKDSSTTAPRAASSASGCGGSEPV